MSFFPLCSVLKTKGFCTMHNFSPNTWEKITPSNKTIWALYTDGQKWISKELDYLQKGETKTYYYDDFGIKKESKRSPIILLQFRKSPLSGNLDTLPLHEFKFTKTPEWRSTVGFQLNNSQTSYQGEINPFPQKASLLTFHPFIQYNNVENHFVFLNVEASPIYRKAEIEIYNSETKILVDKVNILNNHANVIPLNKYGFKQNELPLFICRSMAGIPFGFGISKTKEMLSMEHTHPPASFVIHGERFLVQKQIKQNWFNLLKTQ
tara:strand:+ start:7020 stop:7811 length:792 start_codon:yes stop_codon:yes gene_type:complete